MYKIAGEFVAGTLMVALVICTSLACGGGDSDTPDARRPTDAGIVDGAPDATAPDASTPILPEDLPSPLPTGQVNVTIATYNVGLFPLVKGGDERKPHIVAALEALDADILCLQEIYTSHATQSEIAASLAATYPYSWYDERLVNNQGNGLLIASKIPLYRGRYKRFTMNDTNDVVDRAVISATAANATFYAHILCAHQNSNLDQQGQQIRLDQVAEIKQYATDNGLMSGPSFFLADTNSGPTPASTPACECETNTGSCDPVCQMADTVSFGALLDTWADPNENLDEATYRHSQAEVMATIPIFGLEPSQRVDHCLYRGIEPAVFVSSNIVLDEDQAIDDGQGGTIPYLSDHVGLRCVFQ